MLVCLKNILMVYSLHHSKCMTVPHNSLQHNSFYILKDVEKTRQLIETFNKILKESFIKSAII